MERESNSSRWAWWAAIAALAALAFALRLIGMGESPAGDELIFHWYVDGRSFGSMWDLIVGQEKTPPLGFVLGWLTAHLGDPVRWMRLPSLLAGTATVPAVALLARRCAGPAAGVIAAAFAATSPFLLFYGIESRAYALATFLSCASVVLLLNATDRGGRWRWAAWAGITAMALLSHYTAVFVIIASACWALIARPQRRRSLLAAGLGAALLLAWWIPSFLTQWSHSGSEARRIGNLAPLAASTLSNISIRALVGHPLWSSLQTTPTSAIPGSAALAMIATGLALSLGLAFIGWLRGSRHLRPGSETTLLVAYSLATPIGLILLSLEPGKTLLLPRNLICSLPAVAALVAVPVSRSKRPLGIISTLLIAGGLLLGSIRELHSYGRPDMGAAAAAVSQRWKPGDVILEAIYFNEPPLDQDLLIHLSPEQRRALRLSSKVALAPFEKPGAVGSSVFTVAPIYGYTIEALGPRANRRRGWKLVWKQRWPGLPPVIAAQWRRVDPEQR